MRHLELVQAVEHAVEHAIHFLPCQGPIAVFVHHNTLHALEDLSFDDALKKGLEIYHAQPYLSEDQYRSEVERARIGAEDIEVAIEEDLGGRADEIIFGESTRRQLRRIMLQHVIQTGADNELRWFIAETDALKKFRPDVPITTDKSMVDAVRRWTMREFPNAVSQFPCPLESMLVELFAEFNRSRIERWSDETWRSFTLGFLYRICQHGAAVAGKSTSSDGSAKRHRDIVLASSKLDCDQPVHDLLIRFLGSFMDQGFAQWIIPHREQGIYRCFLQLFIGKSQVTESWMQGLVNMVREEWSLGDTPMDSIIRSLNALGVANIDYEGFIQSTLLALPGWTGMIWQLETNAAWTPQPAPSGSLVEFLAIRLLLDRASLEYAIRTQLEARTANELLACGLSIDSLAEAFGYHEAKLVNQSVEQRAMVLFQVAQLMNWGPLTLASLQPDRWKELMLEISSFRSLERRRVFHSAYERHYRVQVLDAISQNPLPEKACSEHGPVFQLITCIDDREESLRRHLEEFEPQVETFGAAGFFSVAIYYRSAADAHYLPLCPIVMKPQHFVDEIGLLSSQELLRRRAEARRVLGKASHQFHLSSRSLAAGTLTAIMGSVASLPMVARVLAPRLTSRAKHFASHLVRPPAATNLCIERMIPKNESEEGIEPGLKQGFTLEEMANIVERLLGDLGMNHLSRLVVILGHGSSSLNNPHESAYNCGACGGGRGGPNARAFALMANDLRVRQLLEARGLTIPASCFFVAGYHNTCDDSIDYLDFDRLPTSHQEDFLFAKSKLDVARALNAQERSRRFELAPLTISPDDALKHVEARAEDLAQARPEYNHATNAVCFVGRRMRTRGLFMDRRSFLTSYDPTQDDDSSKVLNRILQAVIPVCSGISLEYFFSTVDSSIYGCGSKLPHNITSLLGVMEGAASDLKTGLSQQMTEIHEPLRIIFVIESTPEAMLSIMQRNPNIDRLIRNKWVQIAMLSPVSNDIRCFEDGQFVAYQPSHHLIPTVARSNDWYRGWRNHLGFAKITAGYASVDSVSK